MKEKVKTGLIISSGILYLIIHAIPVIIFLGIIWQFWDNGSNYNHNKKEVTSFLKSNKKELEKIANNVSKNKSSINNPYKHISYVSYSTIDIGININKGEYVKFDYDARGWLGGRYWGLIYSKNNNAFNGEKLYIYDQNKETGNGDNIFIREKIIDNWYFYYDDFDGIVNIDEIK